MVSQNLFSQIWDERGLNKIGHAMFHRQIVSQLQFHSAYVRYRLEELFGKGASDAVDFSQILDSIATGHLIQVLKGEELFFDDLGLRRSTNGVLAGIKKDYFDQPHSVEQIKDTDQQEDE